jgi:hypothetical protein
MLFRLRRSASRRIALWNPLPPSSFDDKMRVSSLVLRIAVRDPGPSSVTWGYAGQHASGRLCPKRFTGDS